MKTLVAKTRELVKADRAATATEYAVLLALILVVVIGAISSFGTSVLGLHAANVSNIL
ncbi:MAG TPA: Flp family type IVb pilin [Phycisphaerae bacterium]|nr:Flp family type IVb pilin [Phycisphaerae bacterium]